MGTRCEYVTKHSECFDVPLSYNTFMSRGKQWAECFTLCVNLGNKLVISLQLLC